MREDTVYHCTTIEDAFLDRGSLNKDFNYLKKQTESQRINNLAPHKNKLSALYSLCKQFTSNYFLKIERYNFEQNFPCVVVFHIKNKSADSILNDHGLSLNLVNLLVKYSDLMLGHVYYEPIA